MDAKEALTSAPVPVPKKAPKAPVIISYCLSYFSTSYYFYLQHRSHKSKAQVESKDEMEIKVSEVSNPQVASSSAPTDDTIHFQSRFPPCVMLLLGSDPTHPGLA